MNYVDYVEVGKRISARRRELGLKQWQVEHQAELSDKYLSNIERATSVLSIDVLMKLCNVLNTTPDALLLGTANDNSDYQRSMSSRLRQMSSKQACLALSLMDWILSQKLD